MALCLATSDGQKVETAFRITLGKNAAEFFSGLMDGQPTQYAITKLLREKAPDRALKMMFGRSTTHNDGSFSIEVKIPRPLLFEIAANNNTPQKRYGETIRQIIDQKVSLLRAFADAHNNSHLDYSVSVNEINLIPQIQ